MQPFWSLSIPFVTLILITKCCMGIVTGSSSWFETCSSWSHTLKWIFDQLLMMLWPMFRVFWSPFHLYKTTCRTNSVANQEEASDLRFRYTSHMHSPTWMWVNLEMFPQCWVILYFLLVIVPLGTKRRLGSPVGRVGFSVIVCLMIAFLALSAYKRLNPKYLYYI